MDIFYYILVKTHKMYTTKSEVSGKLWTLDYRDESTYVPQLKQVYNSGGVLVVGEPMHV